MIVDLKLCNRTTFSHYGNAPDKEDEFIKDFKEYLLQQGVERYNIGW
ncbi:hypothetical protein [Aerococcus urinaeequi]